MFIRKSIQRWRKIPGKLVRYGGNFLFFKKYKVNRAIVIKIAEDYPEQFPDMGGRKYLKHLISNGLLRKFIDTYLISSSISKTE